MRPGESVFLARIRDGEVEVVEPRVIEPGPALSLCQLDGRPQALPTPQLHATRTAALLGLEEQLRAKAREARLHAADIVTRAQRLVIAADRARRMAEGGAA